MNPQNYLIPMVDLYCQWLNRWTEADKVDNPDYHHTYELHQFLVNDPQKGLYGQGEVMAVVPGAGSWSSAFPRFMVVAHVTDGDEGGGSDLTAWFEVNEDNTTEIVAMVQGFDTNMQFIYEDRKFKAVPDVA